MCLRTAGLILFQRNLSAESEGFEPPEPCSSTVFKTASLDHSDNSPKLRETFVFFKSQKFEC